MDLHDIADKVVQDGYIVNTEQLIVSTKNGSTAHVPVIFGESCFLNHVGIETDMRKALR